MHFGVKSHHQYELTRTMKICYSMEGVISGMLVKKETDCFHGDFCCDETIVCEWLSIYRREKNGTIDFHDLSADIGPRVLGTK